MNSHACPSLADLFSTNLSSDIESHIASCPRCQALRSLRDERVEIEPSEHRWSSFSVDLPQVRPGAVALVGAPDHDELLPAVLVRRTEDAVTIVPLTEETRSAAEWDLFLPRELLGYDVVAETWNRGRILPEQIVEVVAELEARDFENLVGLLRAAATGAERPASAHVGPIVLASSDPRLRFQDAESERTHVYWEQTLILAGAASLGELVTARREELGIGGEELAGLSLQHDWLAHLEQNAIDPSTLPRSTLVALMRRLKISASQRLGRIAYATILAHRGGETASGLAFARNRRGMQAHPSDQDPEEFVARFLEDLAKEE